MSKSKLDNELVSSMLEKLNQISGVEEGGSEWLEAGKGKGRRAKRTCWTGDNKVDSSDTNAVLNAILTALCALLEQRTDELKEHKEKISVLEDQNRTQGDLLDEIQQRGLKGNLIIASPTALNKQTMIKSSDELQNLKVSVTDHVCDLIQKKYDVKIHPNDIQACHHLPNKNILLKIWNRKPDSAWIKLKTEIKKGGRKDINIFANFQMTTRRSSLLFHLRSLKKTGKIWKIYSDENGKIGLKINDKSPAKSIITYYSDGKFGTPKTLSVKEIDALVNQTKA